MYFYCLASLLEKSFSPKGPKLTFCHTCQCTNVKYIYIYTIYLPFLTSFVTINMINILHTVYCHIRLWRKNFGWQVLILDPEYNCVAQNMIILICTCVLIPMSLNV